METIKCREEDQGKSLSIDKDGIIGGEKVTNREIGEKLFISSGTVKRRTENVYSKLSVHGRREAVARAMGLGIISFQDARRCRVKTYQM